MKQENSRSIKNIQTIRRRKEPINELKRIRTLSSCRQNHRFRTVFYDTIRQSRRVLEKKPMTKLTLAFKSLSRSCISIHAPVWGATGLIAQFVASLVLVQSQISHCVIENDNKTSFLARKVLGLTIFGRQTFLYNYYITILSGMQANIH